MPQAQLNKHGREIWFERILWSWLPCHWKGWGLIVAVVLSANIAVWLALWIAWALGDEDPWWPFLLLIPFIARGLWLAERHSGPPVE